MDHKGKDSHLSGTSIVELDGTLGKLLLISEFIPSKVNLSIAEVTDEFSSDNILHDEQFKSTNEGNGFGKASGGDGFEGSESSGDISEFLSAQFDWSRKTDSGVGYEVTNDGKHGNTSVLELNISETIETLLASTVEKAKRVELSKGLLGTKGILEGTEGGGGSSLLGRGKGGSRGDERGKNGGLHFYLVVLWNDKNCELRLLLRMRLRMLVSTVVFTVSLQSSASPRF